MPEPTRGFVGRRAPAGAVALPPGQYDAGDAWPVMTAEATPHLSTATWSFAIDGLVERTRRWTWEEIRALEPSTYEGAIHCVTAWSRPAMRFDGVALDTLLALAGPLPAASHALAVAHTGYSASFALADLVGGQAWIAWACDGRPLPVEHGGPARLLVPHLYLWKSVKWIAGLHLTDRAERGFWERAGYHDRGDPWLEQRYRDD
jgi:DMSO/TMAO reductase YedYZ molybdopterin-dependent catalytic subunit